jgi:hypothetical protein
VFAEETVNNIDRRDKTREQEVRSQRWSARDSYVLYITYQRPVDKNVSRCRVAGIENKARKAVHFFPPSSAREARDSYESRFGQSRLISED